MRALAFFIVVGAMLVPSLGVPQASTSTNALWNDSAPKDHIGFWIYPLSGGCPDLRAKAKPLVFATRNQKNEHSVSDLWYCFQFPERAEAPLTDCKSGKVRFKHDAKSQRYSGDYSFVMVDGTKREGSFHAQHCPKGGSDA